MSLNFSWFPGHMKSTLRNLADEEKACSMAIMVLDARCPLSTRNPELESIFKRKPLLYVLNKTDMASAKVTDQWLNYYKSEGLDIIKLSCKSGMGRKTLLKILEEKKQADEKKKTQKHRTRPFRVVVIGLPNTGKSSIINLLSPKKSVKTGKKPGLTRGKQWLKVKSGIEVLDSPGVMIPRMDLEDTPWILGTTAAIKQEILPIELVAGRLLDFLINRNLLPDDLLPDRESITEDTDRLVLIGEFARARGILKKGGIPDSEKASLQLLKMFREGKMGKITLENPPTPPQKDS